MPRRIHLLAACKYCKPSEVLCSQVVRSATANGHRIVEDLAEADVIVVSTCGFDDLRESISMDLFRGAFAGRRPGATVVSMGCLNQIDRQLVESTFPELVLIDDPDGLDALLPGDTPATDEAWCDDGIYRHIHYIDEGEDNVSLPSRVFLAGVRLGAAADRRFDSERLAALHFGQIREQLDYEAKLSVQIGSGCIGHCTYCVIKLAKGEPRSRPVDAVLADIESQHRGQRFVQLVADDCGSYGVDNGETLFELVEAIGSRFPDLPITLTYVNPIWIERQADAYLRMFADSRINSVNISLQSGSDRIVQQMGRHYRVERVLDFVEQVKRVSPRTMIYTHLLVGFPGETWADFRQTVRASDHFHCITVFQYSRRKGSTAFSTPDDVSPAVKRARRTLLHARYAGRLGKRALVG